MEVTLRGELARPLDDSRAHLHRAGEEDGLVHPDVTEAFAESLCARGHVVEYRTYPDVHHVSAVAVVTPDVVAWIVDRFEGEPAPSTCS